MGNAATCSLVDVMGTVTVTQADGQVLEFVQPAFAFQVKKLHPGNWLVHYLSVQDPQIGRHSKMVLLGGNEELRPGEIYFLLPVPSQLRKQLSGSKRQCETNGQHHSASKSSQISQRLQLQLQPLYDMIEGTGLNQPRDSTALATPTASSQSNQPQTSRSQHLTFSSSLISTPQQRHAKRSSRQRFQVLDWRPTLVTIPEVF